MFQFFFGYEIDRKTKVVIGVEFGHLLKAINVFNGENINASNSFPHKFDVGLDIGLSYNITRCFGAEIRYNYGLKGLYQTDEVGVRRSDYKAAYRVFQVGMYYLF